jgi:hypothetical protein
VRKPLYRQTFAAAKLLTEHPPRFRHPHKEALFDMAYPAGTSPAGQVEVTQWDELLPEVVRMDGPLAVDVRPDYYDYVPEVGSDAVEWHVNFADPRLFVAYGSPLFAQDEMQVAEHPLLASVREALLAGGLNAETTDGLRSTPILVRHVERRLEISTKPDAAAGRPHGIYGNRFATAPLDIIQRATRTIEPPTISNIIAIAAPAYGRQEYTRQQIESIFTTAFTGFAAARQESGPDEGVRAKTVVHTGFWGCGAFGGNRKLMVALQVLAARAANLRQVVFHSGDQNGAVDVRRGLDAVEIIESRCDAACPLDDIVARVLDLGYRWGVSDGN